MRWMRRAAAAAVALGACCCRSCAALIRQQEDDSCPICRKPLEDEPFVTAVAGGRNRKKVVTFLRP